MSSAAAYRTIVADPPWPYDQGFAEGASRPHLQDRQRGSDTTGVRRYGLPYPAMSVRDILALPVATLATRDARVFLWATSRYLPTAVDAMRAWGFRYSQTIVWDKTPNFPPMAGGVASIAAEFLLVGSIGSPGMTGRWSTSVIRARKPRSQHSRKPDVFLDMVEAVSPGPYLELFARRQRLGWDTWGDEALKHVEVSA